MGDAEPAVCPHCGSSDTKRFDDSSGLCNACGRAFRGPGAVGSRMVGEDVEARKAAAPRERIKIGLLGLIGGILGFVGIPTVFLLGASLSGRDVSAYVSATFNRPEGVVACGGVTLLVIASWYTTWAAFHVWRGYPERTKHLVIAGALFIEWIVRRLNRLA